MQRAKSCSYTSGSFRYSKLSLPSHDSVSGVQPRPIAKSPATRRATTPTQLVLPLSPLRRVLPIVPSQIATVLVRTEFSRAPRPPPVETKDRSKLEAETHR